MDNAGLEPKWRGRLTTIYGCENLAQGKPGCSNTWEQYIPVMQGYRYLRVQSPGPTGEFAAYGYPAADDAK